jgi:hypothetical protein
MTLNTSFASLEDFVSWYKEHNYPFMPPQNVEVFETDDALTFCLFRQGRYQVELYILNNPMDIKEHSHPGLDIILCPGINAKTPTTNSLENVLWGNFSSVLYSGSTHRGGSDDPEKPYNIFLLAFSKWPKSVTPFTTAAVWRGESVGPKHEALVRRFFPNALIKDGFIDTSLMVS